MLSVSAEIPMTASGHVPVLLEEVLDLLEVRSGGRRVLDGTFGGGGHTRAILAAHPANEVVALDTDPEAAARAEALASDFPGRFTFYGVNFEKLSEVAKGSFDGMLFDLGLSSYHFDTPERGFSFRFDAPADMRLDPREGMPASEFLETASREELVRAIRDYGEEPRWKTAVDAIFRARGTGQLARTASLAALFEEVLRLPPGRQRGSHLHPATRAFQGIRIAVNRELEVIEAMLPTAFAALAEGGRLAIISFHSLEDRLIKRFFRKLSGRPETRFDRLPQDMRSIHGRELTRRPVVPGEEEVARNPRARSAKLRVFQKEAAS